MAEPLTETIQKTLEQAFDRPLTDLRQQLAERLVREFTAAQEESAVRAARQATEETRRATAEALNAAVRRIRQASTVTEAGTVLLEVATGYCGRVALLVHKDKCLAGWRAYGFDRDTCSSGSFAESWVRLEVPVQSAPALAQAIETRDAVVSLNLPNHLSPELTQLLGLGPEEKVYVFPLCLRQTVVAILYADARGAPHGVQPAALELLCSVAEISIEALSSRPSAPARQKAGEAEPGSLQLPISRPATRPPPKDWNELSPSERDMHLRAQRFARVLVADLQLYRTQEIREGKKMRNLYGRLKEEIDKTREVDQRKFGHSVAAGTDYFHVELLHTLAEDQEELLGPDYPGPMIASLVE